MSRHNGKVERSHQSDQRYFYEWESFRTVEKANAKMEAHLAWRNDKPIAFEKISISETNFPFDFEQLLLAALKIALEVRFKA